MATKLVTTKLGANQFKAYSDVILRLADEIAKLAEQRSRPWWRRLRIAG
jgi:hypothetical protein